MFGEGVVIGRLMLGVVWGRTLPFKISYIAKIS